MFRLVLLILLVGISGCGLFSDNPNDDPFDVEVKEEFEIEFEFDSKKLCPPGKDCTVTPTPSPGPIDLPDVQIPVPVDVLALTGSDELKKVSGRLKKVEIVSVDYELIDNTLNIDSPKFKIYVGPSSATQITGSGTVELLEIPSVPPMKSEKGTVKPKPKSLTVASELFKSLKFSTIGYVNEDIERGDLFPAQGKVKYKLTFHLRFVANPVDQFKK